MSLPQTEDEAVNRSPEPKSESVNCAYTYRAFQGEDEDSLHSDISLSETKSIPSIYITAENRGRN